MNTSDIIAMPEWSKLSLPRDLLEIIGDKLDVYRDYVRFRIASSWLRSSLPKWPNHFSYPCLMLPCDDDGSGDDQKKKQPQGFYNILNKEVQYFELPETRERHCVGSSNGWLVTLEEDKLNLLNPFNHSQIPLPHVSTFPDIQDYDPNRLGKEYIQICATLPYFLGHQSIYMSQADVFTAYIFKIVLSFSKPDDFIAVAIYGPHSKLAFTKFGDHQWTDIPTPIDAFCDCVFSADGNIYAINIKGDVVVSTIHNPTQILTHLSNLIPSIDLPSDGLYLVITDDGELLMVGKTTLYSDLNHSEPILLEEEEVEEELDLDNFDAALYLREKPPTIPSELTYGFTLFRLDSNQTSWLPIKSLDDYAIFLGLNTSICISLKDFPSLNGNRIYYSDEQMNFYTEGYVADYDFGVFNLSDGSLQRILYKERPSRLFFWPHPIWVMLRCR